MVKTASTMLPLGTAAPAFSLPNVDGKTVSLKDVTGRKGLLVMFLCNHCPFVKHLRAGLADFALLQTNICWARSRCGPLGDFIAATSPATSA